MWKKGVLQKFQGNIWQLTILTEGTVWTVVAVETVDTLVIKAVWEITLVSKAVTQIFDKCLLVVDFKNKWSDIFQYLDFLIDFSVLFYMFT